MTTASKRIVSVVTATKYTRGAPSAHDPSRLFDLIWQYGHNYGMKTTLVLKDDVVRQAKKRAASRGMTLSEFAERSLRDALAEKPISNRRIVLPTTGHGLPPYSHSVAEIKALEVEDDLQ